MARRWSTLAALLAACLTLPAAADQITLTDGTVVEGRVVDGGNPTVIQTDDGRKITIPQEQIARVSLTSTLSPEKIADAAYTRLQAQIRKAKTLKEIIALQQAFLDAHGSTPAGEKVKDSMAAYKIMEDQGFIHFRGQWMAPAKAEEILKEGERLAGPALELYKASKLKDAIAAAQEALKADEKNPTALAVAGLAYYRLSDLPNARKSFAALAEAEPDEPLAWNNLAVISVQQRRQPEAVGHYLKALQTAPGSRMLLDNITEFLHAYDGSTTLPQYKDLARQYQQAETRLQARMAERNLYRHGGTWITKEQQAAVTAEIARLKTTMNAMETAYTGATTAVDTLTAQMKDIDEKMGAVVADILYYDALIAASQQNVAKGGKPLVTAEAFTYRDALARDLEALRRRYEALAAEKLKQQAVIKQLKAEAPKAKAAYEKAAEQTFTKVQRIMEIGDTDAPAAAPPLPVPVPAAGGK